MRAVDPGWARASPSANEAPTTGTVRLGDHRTCRGRGRDAGQRTRAIGRVALVEDDHGAGAGGLRVVGLQGEAAPATLDEGDRPGGEAGEVVHTRRVGDERGPTSGLGVRAVAAARVGPRRRQVDVDRDHVGGHVTERRPVNPSVVVRGLYRRELLQLGDALLEGERHDLDVPAGRRHRLDDVVDACRVPGRLVDTGTAVGVGDRLKGRLVLPHPGHRDALEQLVVLVVVASLARVLPRPGFGCSWYEQPGQRSDGDEAGHPAPTE